MKDNMIGQFWLILLVLPAIQCVPRGQPIHSRDSTSCPLENPFVPFKALTYNTILHDYAWREVNLTNNREQRLEALIEYLKTSEADVICLQEVFIGDDMELLVNELASEYPYSHSQLHLFDGTLPPQRNGTRAPACSIPETIDLSICGEAAGCDAENTEESLAECFFTNCEAEVIDLLINSRDGCANCLLSVDLPVAVQKCVINEEDSYFDMNTLGLLMLSKRRLTEPLVIPFYPNTPILIDRGYIQATINDEITIGCTHFSYYEEFTAEPVLDQYFPTASAQNDYEVRDFINRLNDSGPSVLLGDYNVSPNSGNILGVKEGNYQLLTDAFKTELGPQCTYCSDNPYNIGKDTVNVAIDHIFVDGGLKMSNTTVVLTANEANVTTDGALLPLSDHYGVMTTVTCDCDVTQNQALRPRLPRKYPRGQKPRFSKGKRKYYRG